jgi:2-dehydropantoate 2-reductase
MMRVAVFGAGGVGGYFGGRLAQAGEDVVFIARGEHLRALQSSGLRVDSIKGDFHLQPVQASDEPSRVGVVDAILVAVKAWQVADAAQVMRPMVGPSTFVVPLQNGVEAPYELIDALGAGHTLGGLCRISALVAAPGHIRHVGIEPYIAFGELDRRPSQRSEQLRLAFETAGVQVQVPEDIHIAMWEKFVFIAAISGVGGVVRLPLGALRSVPETRQMLAKAMQEIVAVARGRGINLASDLVRRTLALIDGSPYGVSASMARDIIEGRPSELHYQNGAVVRMGRKLGIPTPVNAFIYASLLPQEMQARGELQPSPNR